MRTIYGAVMAGDTRCRRKNSQTGCLIKPSDARPGSPRGTKSGLASERSLSLQRDAVKCALALFRASNPANAPGTNTKGVRKRMGGDNHLLRARFCSFPQHNGIHSRKRRKGGSVVATKERVGRVVDDPDPMLLSRGVCSNRSTTKERS